MLSGIDSFWDEDVSMSPWSDPVAPIASSSLNASDAGVVDARSFRHGAIPNDHRMAPADVPCGVHPVIDDVDVIQDCCQIPWGCRRCPHEEERQICV